MLYKTQTKFGKTLYHSRPLLITPKEAYVRPGPGKDWFATTTTVWRVDELIRRRVRDWRRLTGETGHTGERAEKFRKDHDSVFTGTYSVFPVPLVEWILLRYGGPPGGRVLDAFAGGPPRAMVSSIMGYHYEGFDVRQEQIDENLAVLKPLKLDNITYHLGDGTLMEQASGLYDCGLTCPPYFDLETYSEQADDISNLGTYGEFDEAMWKCASAYRRQMKTGAFVCIVIGNFRDKSGELVDFRSDTVRNFRDVGFKFHQEIILSKNFGSAAKRSTNAWKGMKLVSIHEFLLVFRNPE
jgi:DNA methylase